MTPLAARPLQPATGVPVAIGIGSNLGDRLAHMDRALALLARQSRVTAVSPVFETKPMFVLDQPVFYNAACLLETDWSPRDLVERLKEIERMVGRCERLPQGPREIDLDLLVYGALIYRFRPGDSVARPVQVPHPGVADRRFVLEPLAAIAPLMEVPGLGRVESLLASTESEASAVRWKKDAVLSLHG